MEIKKIGEDSYKCPECGAEHSGKEWNNRTLLEYFDDITEIQDTRDDECYYICPTCNKESTYEEKGIQEETVTITKREYDELLEIKFRYEELD
jgi:RNA polymerase subunit RPABC4/transcription elongation factor Spt4